MTIVHVRHNEQCKKSKARKRGIDLWHSTLMKANTPLENLDDPNFKVWLNKYIPGMHYAFLCLLLFWGISSITSDSLRGIAYCLLSVEHFWITAGARDIPGAYTCRVKYAPQVAKKRKEQIKASVTGHQVAIVCDCCSEILCWIRRSKYSNNQSQCNFSERTWATDM